MVSYSEDTVGDLLALAGVALVHAALPDALQEVCLVAERAVPMAEGASMTGFEVSGPEVVAASNDWAGELDEMQYAEHEGPCIDAARTGVLFRVRDATSETRWPSYMPRAVEHGALSMMSIPMTVEAKTIGAINVYAKEVDAFGAEDVSVAEIIAAHASLATQVTSTLHEHRNLSEQLRTAMASRATIEQAKGIIMATVGCDADTAFERLAQQSQHENRKLREIAEDLVRQARRDQRP
jgi:GAF domain-containing protein